MAILLCLYVLKPLFQIAVYNRPGMDDYGYGLRAYMALNNGGGVLSLLKAACDTVKWAYTSFSGLYTSAFMLALHPGIWGEKAYALSTWIIFGTIYFLTFWSVFILNRNLLKRSVLFVATASLVLVTTIVLRLPSPSQGLYWYNGAMNYMPFAFMIVLNLCLLLEVDSAPDSRKAKSLLGVSMVLSFLISGGNHVTSFANILLLLFVAAYKGTRKQFYVLLPLLTACVGFAIMYFSPGTQSRAAFFAGEGVSRSAVGTIIATLRRWQYIPGEWMSISWMLSMLVVTPTAMEVAYKNRERFSRIFPVGPLVMTFTVISGMLCVPHLATGFFGEGRVMNVIWIAFVLLSWFDCFMIWGWLAANDLVNFRAIFEKKYCAAAALLAVCVGVFGVFRFHDGVMSSSMLANQELAHGKAAYYGQQMDERIEKFKAPGLIEVSVTPIQDPSSLLFVAEIEENPLLWPNDVMGTWYGGKQISLTNVE